MIGAAADELRSDELETATQRLTRYAAEHGLTIGDRLGFGVHGSVYEAERQEGFGRSAIKGFDREDAYLRERDVYLRLQSLKIVRLCDCNVPQLLAFDDSLWVVEMTIVKKPYVLDFAGAYLDHKPDFSAETLEEWRTAKAEQFGDQWPKVETILWALERHGIFLIDVNPNNIAFDDPVA